MEQYKTDAEIYAVLEREIIDLTIRPGSPLSENPLCARFGAPRTLIRMVLQRLKESGLVRIVPYKGTTVTRLNRCIVDELIYERTAVEAKVLRDFTPKCTPEQRALIRVRVDAYEALARAEAPDYNKLYEADRLLHETWFAAMDKMYLWSTLQNAHADYSRFRMLDTMTTGGLDEVIADHRNLLNAIERCDLAAFEPLVERHLYGGIRRLGSKLTGEYADYFEPEPEKEKNVPPHCSGHFQRKNNFYLRDGKICGSSRLAFFTEGAQRGTGGFFIHILALSVTFGDSSPKGRALGGPHRLHLFANVSPFDRRPPAGESLSKGTAFGYAGKLPS